MNLINTEVPLDDMAEELQHSYWLSNFEGFILFEFTKSASLGIQSNSLSYEYAGHSNGFYLEERLKAKPILNMVCIQQLLSLL